MIISQVVSLIWKIQS